MNELIELLPLPKWMSNYIIPSDGFEHDEDVMLDDRMHDYARACVAHATAAQVTEIEALRAKAAEHRDGRLAALERAERLQEEVAKLRNLRADTIHECALANIRTERLIEALKEAYGQVRELCDAHVHPYPEASFARYETALLPTAAQEKDDA